MIYITGDKHGTIQLEDLSPENWPEGQKLTKNDYLIIAGDFGGVFFGGERDDKVLDFYESRPWTTLFVDGNHENFDLLNQYPVSEWNGGKVHFIRPSIIHLMRGQIFTIEGRTFFTMGGATSLDKGIVRDVGHFWWEEELPCWEEYVEADRNLELHGNKVDYIVTHCCSPRQFYSFAARRFSSFQSDNLTDYLNELEKRVSFTHWYYGHHHEDIEVDERHTMLCRKVVRVETFCE